MIPIVTMLAKDYPYTKDFIKFSDEKSWAGIGTNVFPLSSGMSCLGRFDFTSSEVDSGTAVYAKFRPAVDDLGWSQQTAINTMVTYTA